MLLPSPSRTVVSFALLCGAAVFAVAGCEAYDLGDENAPAVAVNASAPTWENGVREVLARRCDNCHAKEARSFAPGTVAPYKVGFSTDKAAFEKKWASASLAAINDKASPMPPDYADPLSADERKALETYLKKVTDAANPLSECTKTTTSYTYARDIAPVVESCQGCHSGTAQYGGGAKLEEVADWKTYRVSALEYLTGKRATYMPPSDTKGEYAKGEAGQKVIEWLCASEELK